MTETLGQKVKRLRLLKGISQTRLAADANLDRSYISEFENDKVVNPRTQTILSIAKALNISPAIFFNESSDNNLKYHQLTNAEVIDVSIKAYMPVYAEISAGEGMEPIDYVACSRLQPAPESYRAYRVKGLCLEPEIREGDTLIVDTAKIPKPNDLVVVIIDGQASVKRYRASSNEGNYLENNYGRYRPEDVHVHGVVVEFNRKMP